MKDWQHTQIENAIDRIGDHDMHRELLAWLRLASSALYGSRTTVDSGFVPWTADKEARYNGSGEPCDMWSGPCSCGAWHRDGR